jgi:hypothetical protein
MLSKEADVMLPTAAGVWRALACRVLPVTCLKCYISGTPWDRKTSLATYGMSAKKENARLSEKFDDTNYYMNNSTGSRFYQSSNNIV